MPRELPQDPIVRELVLQARRMQVSRRHLLQGAGVGAGVLALAACTPAGSSAPKPAEWAKVEASEDGRNWRELKLKPKGETGLQGDVSVSARAVRVRNGGKPADVKIALLKVRLAEDAEGGSAFIDGRLDTLAPLGAGQFIEIPADARGVTLFFGSGSGKGAAVGVSATKDGSTRSLGAAAGDVAGDVAWNAARDAARDATWDAEREWQRALLLRMAGYGGEA